MRIQKNHKPFSLYQKETKTGAVWYVRFWDETAKRYAVTRSTGVLVEGKKQRRYEAEQAARKMLPGIRLIPVPEKSFVKYVENFWLPDSPYVREYALVKKKPLSVAYVTLNHNIVRLHIESFPGMQGVTLQNITAGVVRDWMAWAAGNGVSGRTINIALQSMRVATRHAIIRQDISNDPFLHIKKAPEERQEKGILSAAEVTRLIAGPIKNTQARLAVLLALLCGLRRGEVRGLKWGDIKNGIITICHNYQEDEGLKEPKWGSRRQVPVPNSLQTVLDKLFIVCGEPGHDEFIMAHPLNPIKPLSTKFFERALSDELDNIGIHGRWKGKETQPEEYINEQRKRNLTFHGLRHTYVTLSRLAGITDLEIQALAGHKSGAMMERYSHVAQVIDFSAAKDKLEKAIGG